MFLPNLALINFRIQINKSFELVVNPIVGEYQTKNASYDESIILFLTLPYNHSQDLTTNPSAIAIFDHDFKLDTILLQKYESNQSV